MSDKRTYSYYAFISYNHKDEKWAKWLQNRLETYSIPSVLRKENIQLPKRVYPVFRDKTDLAGGRKLLDTLRGQLDESRHLIVICSPNSAGSEWVNAEVRYFMENGREDDIIPVIVDGEPFAENPEQECYPPALRTDMQAELLGVNVKTLGRRHAFLQVVASLLDLKFDRLMRRDQKRRRQRRIIYGAAAVLLAALAAGGLWYYMPHSAYYRSYIYVNEVPQGVYKLSGSERAGIYESYRIVTRMGKVVEVQRVNSAGKVTNSFFTGAEMEESRIAFYYEGDRISRAVYSDESGRTIYEKNYSSDLRAVDFVQPNDGSRMAALAADRMDGSLNGSNIWDVNKSEITRYINTYDENGYLVRRMFMRDNRNTPVMDSNGIYGMAYEHNENGQVTRITYLDADGKPMQTRHGDAARISEFNEKGETVGCEYLDLNGERTNGPEGYSRMTVEYQNGNPVLVSYFDRQDRPINVDGIYAKIKMEFDSQGFMVECSFFDTKDEPAYNESGVHGFRNQYDERGNAVESVYFDENGTICLSTDGYAIQVMQYDEKDRVVYGVFQDVEGEPIPDRSSGECALQIEYTEDGNLARLIVMDENDEPVINRYGYAALAYVYNEDGYPIRVDYYDAQGELYCGERNYTSCLYGYDERGNRTDVIYLDAEGRRISSDEGFAEIVWEYNDSGNLILESYYDEQGNPTVSDDGYHEVRYDYDEWGNRSQRSYYDVEGQPQLTQQGYAVDKDVYDAWGNRLEFLYYDIEGNPVQNNGDHYGVIQEYDERGNVVKGTRYSFDESEYATKLRTYDEHNNLLEERFADKQENPCTDSDGVAVYRYSYDSRNRQILEMYFSLDGSQIEVNGYAAVEQEYDEYSDVIKRIYYRIGEGDETGEILRQVAYRYNEYGDCVEEVCLDADGLPMTDDSGSAYKECSYDELGRPVEYKYYDEKHEACLYQGKYFRVTSTYDQTGNEIARRYYDENGQPGHADGYAAEKKIYNVQGWLVERVLTDGQGELAQLETGKIIRLNRLYSENGAAYDVLYYVGPNEQDPELFQVMFYNVESGSSAQAADIQELDILFEMNGWSADSYEDPEEAMAALQALMAAEFDQEKRVVVGRIVNDTVKVSEKVLEPGVMGIQLANCPPSAKRILIAKLNYLLWKTQNEE